MTAVPALASPTDDSVDELRVRRAQSLVVVPVGERFVLTNILTTQAISCGTRILELLAAFEHWQTIGAACRRFPYFASQSLQRTVHRLVTSGALVIEGSPAAALDDHYRSDWAWDVSAGLFHFGTKNCHWSSPEDVDRAMAERSAAGPGPQLYETHGRDDVVVPLPEPDMKSRPLDVMRARRSERAFGSDPLRLTALSQALFSGFGILSIEDRGAFGMLPFTMTPSGGARNPYEAYVLARNVEGLATGVHHYSAGQHTLKDCQIQIPALGRIMADREWVDAAAAIVLLVANFQRTMWKYTHPTAYRVVVLEAGHIVQNMLLTATAEDVAAVPMAAVNDAVAEDLLGLDPITQAVIHAVVLGERRVDGS